ncbi:MAG TPA: hypothetical protein VJM51_06360 [Dehalococcoidia bacterium]|nr:hypothetical protein [Dehalococcoidia bacterium]
MSRILQWALLLGVAGITVLFARGAPLVAANLTLTDSDSAASNTTTIQAVGTKLAFIGQPTGGTEGQPWPKFPSTTVSVQDAAGNLDNTNNSAIVTLTITPGTGATGAVLMCDNDENATAAGVQVTAGNGVAPFFGCAIDKANSSNNPYTLTASASGLTSAVSNSFSVTANATPTPTPIPSATSTPTPTPVVSNCSWTGTWSTTYKTMQLTQSGSAVTGTYEYNSGRISGTASGATASGRWDEGAETPGGDGGFIWTMSADCNSFTGTWGNGSYSTGGSWSGTRTTVTVATPTPTTPPATSSCSWTGDWSTEFNAVHLTQSGSTATGTYEWDSGRITGTVSGNQFSGRWSESPSYTEPSDAGRFIFTISADCNSFTGTWGYGSSSTGGSWSGTRMSATAPAPSPTTVPIGPSGGDIAVGGGTSTDGGVTVTIPAGTFSSTVELTVSVANTAPTGVSSSGAVLLPKTIEVTADTGAALSETVELQVNLTVAELSGHDINTIKGGVIVGNTVDPRPTRVLNATDGTLGVTLDHFSKFTLFAITNPAPGLVGPAAGTTLNGLGTTLSWSNPLGTTQYQLQVVPFNNDGPGVNVIRNADTSFVVPAPPEWYGLLPDILYFWRVRTTTVTTTPTAADWTAWGSWTFRTPKMTSATINAVLPAQGAEVSSRTPTLTWSNTNLESFYYEVQVSKDASFNTDPATATAMVYWVLLHGGVTNPPNSYAIPAAFPLEASTPYFWRVRPRIQGDGTPVAWSATWSFNTQQ